MIFNLIVWTLKIKNLGVLKFTLPETFAIYERAIFKMWHDLTLDEIVHHVIGYSSVIGNVATHD